MKLPVLTSLLLVSSLLQMPIVAQAQSLQDSETQELMSRGRPGGPGRPGHPGHGPRPRPQPPRPQPQPPRPQPAPVPPRPQPQPPRPQPAPVPPRPQPQPPRPQPAPIPPGSHYGEAVVSFAHVTRRTGGEWLRVGFHRPTSIERATIQVFGAPVRVYEAYVITQFGRYLPIREFSRGMMLSHGQMWTSEYLNMGERVVAVDIRAEAMGGVSTLNTAISSSEGVPAIYPTRY